MLAMADVEKPPREQLRRARERAKLSRAALADRVDTAERVIASLERGEQRLSDVWIEKLAPALNISPADLFLPAPLAPQVSVVGRVAAGVFVPELEWEQELQYTVALPLTPRVVRAAAFGLEVGGDSMDMIYPEGSVVVVAKLERLGEVPQPNRIYVIERDVDGLREYTLKRLVMKGADAWLVPMSSNPEHQAVRLQINDGETIRIRARVVGALMQD